MLLTFPVMGIKLNSVDQTVEWQFDRVILLGVAIFFLSMLWNWCFSRKARGIPLIRLPEGLGKGLHSLVTLPNRNTTTRLTSLGLLLAVMIVMPLVSSFYQTNIMISAMLYVILALGLNIAVGIAGQLVLGYVAFYAVGAYSYALLNQAFGLGFWACLPVGGFMAIVFGLALGFPVLRLRGDYLAIVTLGFGEIVRLVLLNWTSLTGGSGGIKNIPGPSFFGQELEIAANTIFIYYLVLLAVIVFWIFYSNRLTLTAIHPQLASSRGIPVGLSQTLFTAAIAVVVTLSISSVGLLILNSLLVLPGASARNVARNLKQYHGFSVLFAFLAGVVGLTVSYYSGCSAGAAISLGLAAVFAVTFCLRKVRA